ncbi:MAG: hypothetical protein GY817_01035 [bacterium]|nr:hypothetical protein [bacterium]
MVLIFESDKESGSKDIYSLFTQHKILFGRPDLILNMDSVVPDYETFYNSFSLKGKLDFNLKITVGSSDTHSGLGGGLYPDIFRISSVLIDRIQNYETEKFDSSLDLPMDPTFLK